MTDPSLLPPTRTQLLEALAVAETKLAIAKREQYSAEHTYREARTVYGKYGGDALYDEADKLWGLWDDKQNEQQDLAKKVETLKARLLELDNARTEAARNRRLYPLTADEQAALDAAKAENAARTQARLDDLGLQIQVIDTLRPEFTAAYTTAYLTERLTAKRIAAGCLARQYLNSQEWQNLMSAQDEPAFAPETETDRPLYFINGGTDEAGGVGDGQALEEIF